MVVKHNLSAMNSNRMLGITTATLSSSTEKLSSGYKINRAADDAAGLAISEKMRKQIRGLTQASANAEDGISAVQTAEGALAEVQDMLQRMNELAVKSANGTNSETDRSYIQNEIDQLVTEIDRVAQTTKFNETYLLNGDNSVTKTVSYSYAKATAAIAQTASAGLFKDEATSTEVTVAFEKDTVSNATANDLVNSLTTQGLTVTTSLTANGASTSLQLNGDAASNYKIVTTTLSDDGKNKFSITDLQGNKVATVTIGTVSSVTGSVTILGSGKGIQAQISVNEIAQLYDSDGNAISANALGNYFAATLDSDGAVENVYVKAESGKLYDAVGKEITKKVLNSDWVDNVIKGMADVTGALNIKFQVGADTSSANKISINIDALTAKGLGINGLKVDGTDSTNADSAVNTIAQALQQVSKQRSTLGAIQNRLEHTINNLDNVVENTTSAESEIRDTDMATEMVTYSNANILAQAGQAMLAQANQSNQGVLTLLG